MNNSVTTRDNIYVNVNGSHFKFIDVDGEGNCLYHSILKNNNLSSRFQRVRRLRSHLQTQVCNYFQNDVNLKKVFEEFQVDFIDSNV